jgi:delta14-sterol reductase
MWLYQLFTFVYLANASQTEHGMLYMWDVLEEKFGWMLVWGDYVLVPSEYCRVARFRMIPFVY